MATLWQSMKFAGTSQARLGMLQQLHTMLQRTTSPEALQPHASDILSLLTTCLTDASHPPSCIMAMDCLCAMVAIMGGSFAPYTGTTCAILIERQGDVDASIQQQAFKCLLATATAVGVAACIQGMMAGVLHLNAHIREQTLVNMVNVLLQHKAPTPTWQPLVPRLAHVAQYDSHPRVRAAAMHALTVAGAACGVEVIKMNVSNTSLLTAIQSSIHTISTTQNSSATAMVNPMVNPMVNARLLTTTASNTSTSSSSSSESWLTKHKSHTRVGDTHTSDTNCDATANDTKYHTHANDTTTTTTTTAANTHGDKSRSLYTGLSNKSSSSNNSNSSNNNNNMNGHQDQPTNSSSSNGSSIHYKNDTSSSCSNIHTQPPMFSPDTPPHPPTLGVLPTQPSISSSGVGSTRTSSSGCSTQGPLAGSSTTVHTQPPTSAHTSIHTAPCTAPPPVHQYSDDFEAYMGDIDTTAHDTDTTAHDTDTTAHDSVAVAGVHGCGVVNHTHHTQQQAHGMQQQQQAHGIQQQQQHVSGAMASRPRTRSIEDKLLHLRLHSAHSTSHSTSSSQSNNNNTRSNTSSSSSSSNSSPTKAGGPTNVSAPGKTSTPTKSKHTIGGVDQTRRVSRALTSNVYDSNHSSAHSSTSGGEEETRGQQHGQHASQQHGQRRRLLSTAGAGSSSSLTSSPSASRSPSRASMLSTQGVPNPPPSPPSPRTTLTTILDTLHTANAAGRKDLDWAAQQSALETALTIVQQQSTVVKPMVHALVLALAPAVDALRSQTARRALQLLHALLQAHPRGMEREVEVFLPGVLRRAGEGSTRETFLAGEAENVLCVLCENAMHGASGGNGNGGAVKVLNALLGYAGHKNAAIRGCAAAHLARMAEGGGLPSAGGAAAAGGGVGGHALLCKLLAAGVALAEEGSADTRKDGKRLLAAIKRHVVQESGGGGGAWGALVSGMSEAQQKRAAVLLASI